MEFTRSEPLGARALKGLLVGTVLATLLLGAQTAESHGMRHAG